MLPNLKTILYCTNLGPESPYVFRYALSLAKHYRASIHILHTLEPLGDTAKGLVEFFLTEEDLRNRREEAKQHLLTRLKSRLATFCEEQACKPDAQMPEAVADVQVIEGRPSETILEQAKAIGADVIVMGTHRRASESRARLLGSTARSVVNSSTIPVLAVHTPKDKLEELEPAEAPPTDT